MESTTAQDAGIAVKSGQVQERINYWCAIFDYVATSNDELSLKRGTKVEVITTDPKISGSEGWWTGKINGKVGVFPKNFVSSQVKPPKSDALQEIDFSELQLGDVVGVGGFGKVYRSLWKSELVAVKVARSEGKSERDAIIDVKKEARYYAIMDHPNIVSLRGVCLQPPNVCLVQEYAEGGSVQGALHKLRANLPPDVLVDWAIQIAKGMRHLHDEAIIPLVHRDLKSNNILVKERITETDFQNKTLLITDFGLAREIEQTTMMSGGGTYAWMAPEVIQHNKFSKASDIWSFGVVLWELVTGEIPYEGINPLAIAYNVVNKRLTLPIPSTVPTVFSDLMSVCWSEDLKERPDFSEIVQVLEEIRDSSFMGTHQEAFATLRNDWKEEIEDIYNVLREKEQEIRDREQEMEKKVEAHKQHEDALMRREEDLAQRELEIFERELNYMIHEQQLVPEPQKRKGKFNKKKLKHIKDTKSIGSPIDFRHNIAVKPNRVPTYNTLDKAKKIASSPISPPGSPHISSVDDTISAYTSTVGVEMGGVDVDETRVPNILSRSVTRNTVGSLRRALMNQRTPNAVSAMGVMLGSVAMGFDFRFNSSGTMHPKCAVNEHSINVPTSRDAYYVALRDGLIPAKGEHNLSFPSIELKSHNNFHCVPTKHRPPLYQERPLNSKQAHSTIDLDRQGRALETRRAHSVEPGCYMTADRIRRDRSHERRNRHVSGDKNKRGTSANRSYDGTGRSISVDRHREISRERILSQNIQIPSSSLAMDRISPVEVDTVCMLSADPILPKPPAVSSDTSDTDSDSSGGNYVTLIQAATVPIAPSSQASRQLSSDSGSSIFDRNATERKSASSTGHPALLLSPGLSKIDYNALKTHHITSPHTPATRHNHVSPTIHKKHLPQFTTDTKHSYVNVNWHEEDEKPPPRPPRPTNLDLLTRQMSSVASSPSRKISTPASIWFKSGGSTPQALEDHRNRFSPGASPPPIASQNITIHTIEVDEQPLNKLSTSLSPSLPPKPCPGNVRLHTDSITNAKGSDFL